MYIYIYVYIYTCIYYAIYPIIPYIISFAMILSTPRLSSVSHHKKKKTSRYFPLILISVSFVFAYPIGSMYGIYGNIYHQYTQMLAYIAYMDPMGIINGDLFLSLFQASKLCWAEASRADFRALGCRGAVEKLWFKDVPWVVVMFRSRKTELYTSIIILYIHNHNTYQFETYL